MSYFTQNRNYFIQIHSNLYGKATANHLFLITPSECVIARTIVFFFSCIKTICLPKNNNKKRVNPQVWQREEISSQMNCRKQMFGLCTIAHMCTVQQRKDIVSCSNDFWLIFNEFVVVVVAFVRNLIVCHRSLYSQHINMCPMDSEHCKSKIADLPNTRHTCRIN